MAAVFAIVAIAYVALTSGDLLSPYADAVLTDVIWTFGSLTATLACLAVSRHGDPEDRTAWKWLTAACGIWFCGELFWAYYRLLSPRPPGFPHWTQILFFAYPTLSIVGLLRLPRPKEEKGVTLRHAGNLVLIACAVAMSITIAMWEPVAQSGRNWAGASTTLVTTAALAMVSMTALYLLWSYQWRNVYWPLLLVALGASIHTITYVTNLHLRLTSAYDVASWYNIGWMLGFGALACAAYERLWQRRHPSSPGRETDRTRERWSEAVIPALLIIAMLFTARMSGPWLTPRVINVAMVIAVVFAVALSLRDAWMQRAEQSLLVALNASNQSLTASNRELISSEERYRALNAELEKRVSDRTRELQAAYRELESFSYAVAHDIKVPLRAVNSFASLLIQEHGPQLDSQALEVEAAIVHADKAALTQSVRNLLQNALKFSSRSSPPRIALRTRIDAGSVLLSVADNGIGFDMRYHDQIFGLFQRLHRAEEYPGTGIGLAITRKAIERMGGRVWAQSSVNEGATFYVELPVMA